METVGFSYNDLGIIIHALQCTGSDVVLAMIQESVFEETKMFDRLVHGRTAPVFLHYVMARLSRYSSRFGHLVKGTELLLIKDGQVDQQALKKSNMTEHDLYEALRSSGSTNKLEDIHAAYLERSGEVSVITK
jgi:uncharacterized membrane protein YcaP (DUF421 family)